MSRLKIILFVVSVGLLGAGSVLAGPDVSVSETNFNFGKTVQHASVSHTFWIKSTGDDTLRISKVIPGCGCTKAPLTDSTLAPGDSAALEIIFSTKSYRGYISKKPYFETNISDKKEYLRIDVELFADESGFTPLSFNPFRIDVSQFTEKPRRKAKFSVSNNSEEDVRIKIIDMNNKYFEVDLPEMIKAGETVEGVLTVYKEHIEKQFEQSFSIEVNENPQERYSIPVKRKFRILKKKK